MNIYKFRSFDKLNEIHGASNKAAMKLFDETKVKGAEDIGATYRSYLEEVIDYLHLKLIDYHFFFNIPLFTGHKKIV